MSEFKAGDLVMLEGDSSGKVYELKQSCVADQVFVFEDAHYFYKDSGEGVEDDSSYPRSVRCDPESKPEPMQNYQNFSTLQMNPTMDYSQYSGIALSEEPGTWTKDQYAQFVEKTFADMLALIKRKNSDYTGKADDPFANFRRAEAVGVDPLNGLAVRFLDKVARIESFFQKGKLENESFEDAWLDVIGYACLALGMLKERGGK